MKVHRHRLLEAGRAVSGSDDDLSPAPLHAEPVKRPVRRTREDCGRWWNGQAWRTGRGLAEGMHERLVGMVSLHAGHLLRENHRHEGLEDSLRLGYPQAGMVPANFGQERMGRRKARVVILLPAQRGGSRRGPRRARSPRLDLDCAVRMLQMDGGGAFGRERRAPRLAVSHPEPCALADRREGQP